MLDTDSEALTTAACPTQRWNLGRAFWRTDRDEGFRRQDYSIDLIEHAPARAFVQAHHYSGSYPFALARVGLFKGARLVGVAVFSTPINSNALNRYAGVPASEGVELGRFVLLDEVPYNAETFFLAGAFSQLRKVLPRTKAVLAYSDPMPRASRSGGIVMPGHVGVIYQASSAHYVGRSAPQTLHLTSDGVAVSSRGISKIRLQEFGASSAEKRLVALGAPPRSFLQDPAAWVKEVLAGPTFQRVRHPGNHVYVFPIGGRLDKRRTTARFSRSLPYPKRLDPTQSDLLTA